MSRAVVETGLTPERWRRERAHWEALGSSMPDLFDAPSTRYYRRREIDLIRRHAGPLAGRAFLKLDLWNEAINTRILEWVASRGARAVGLDASRVVTERARNNLRTAGSPAHSLQADMRRLPFPDDSFDIVYTMGTIEHVKEYGQALSEVARVLKPGGRAIVGVPHRWNIFLRPLLVELLDRIGKYPYSPERSFSAGELRRLLADRGLEIVHRTGLLAIPGVVRMADLFLFRRGITLQRLIPWVIRPFEWLERSWSWPNRLGYLLVMIAGKPAGDHRLPGPLPPC